MQEANHERFKHANTWHCAEQERSINTALEEETQKLADYSSVEL